MADLKGRENLRGRTREVRVKLQPDMLTAFEEISRRRGVAPATLAAVIIGEYIERNELNQQYQRGAIESVVQQMIGELTKPGAMESLVAMFGGLDQATGDAINSEIVKQLKDGPGGND